MNLKIDKQINYLVGQEDILVKPLSPYSELVCDFLNELSSTLIKNKKAQEYPDVISFAFWCRKANILKLKDKFLLNDFRLGVGLVFHISPSNIPVNFAFSFAFGLLAGNSNIVRVPSKDFKQTHIICNSLNAILKSGEYKTLERMTAFISYERDYEITSFLSQKCNGRIIWGGDKTINEIKSLPSSPRCIDIAFSDRFSFSIIDSSSLFNLDEDALNPLIEGFYNDTYLMDQNACSSPHLIVWMGKSKKEAKELFWDSLYKRVKQKYELAEVTAVDKYTHLCENIIDLDNIKEFNSYENLLYVLNLNKLEEKIELYHGKFGHFFEYDTDNLDDLVKIVNNKYQTLTYFGINKIKLAEFIVDNSLLGIDRVVPVGQALDINVVWDGYDLISKLSRIIDIK
jgi:hypothetical protein